MLASLRIRNFALVESLAWEIPRGFVAITGETGAGKSILVGGLELLLGERADKSAIRSGASECAVEAAFDLGESPSVDGLLADCGIDPCEGGLLLLRRVIPLNGAGRQFANGCACTLAALKRIGERLVDLHGPHDHQSLFSVAAQTRLLDAYGGALAAAEAYRAERKSWLALRAEREAAASDEASARREIDLLEHQVAEIDAAALKPGEDEALAARHRTASGAHRLLELGGSAAFALSEAEGSAEARAAEAVRALREMAKIDSAAESLADAAAAAAAQLADVARDISAYATKVDADPAALREIEERLDAVESLKRKYGSSAAAVLEFGENARARLAALRAREERRDGLDAEIAAAGERAATAAKALSALRAKAAPKLASDVRRHLADLGFLKAGFEIRIEPGELSPDGAESVEFVFSPNPGEPAQPLRAIASSGEISRVMLALKTSLAAQDDVPVLVFDEIDANVGGEIANAVGEKMREIGRRRQVLCITHLAQVAARAPGHFVVAKRVTDGRTASSVEPVSGLARKSELARMLGNRDGAAALAHAGELLALS